MRTASSIAASALLLAALLTTAACGSSGLFRQYEYEEEVYLSLDGSATVYVNSSIPALNALRGTSFDPDPDARFNAYIALPINADPKQFDTLLELDLPADSGGVERTIELIPSK